MEALDSIIRKTGDNLYLKSPFGKLIKKDHHSTAQTGFKDHIKQEEEEKEHQDEFFKPIKLMTCADLLAKPIHKSRGHNSITDELNLLVHPSKLSTGCKHIDRFLKGGLPSKRLIEIFGEGSTGKTQFICQLMINSVLPADHGGLGGKALAIFTGKPLSEKRFTDIKDHIVQQNPDIITSDDIDRNIKLLQASDMEIFNDIMNDIETKVGKENIR